MEISLRNVNVSFLPVTSTQFSGLLLCMLSLKIISPKYACAKGAHIGIAKSTLHQYHFSETYVSCHCPVPRVCTQHCCWNSTDTEGLGLGHVMPLTGRRIECIPKSVSTRKRVVPWATLKNLGRVIFLTRDTVQWQPWSKSCLISLPAWSRWGSPRTSLPKPEHQLPLSQTPLLPTPDLAFPLLKFSQ